MKTLIILAACGIVTAPAFAGPEDFHPGTVIPDYGNIATIDMTIAPPENPRISFDVSAAAETGELNRTLVSAARFINMNAEAGIDPETISVAVVVHGGAVRDVSNADIYGSAHDGAENANAALIAALLEQGVRIYVCGQSATYYDVETEDLLPGVDMALSAMTAHTMLQQQGYAINPF